MQRQYKSLLFLRELDNEPEIDVGKKTMDKITLLTMGTDHHTAVCRLELCSLQGMFQL